MKSQLHFLVAGAASVTACWPLLCALNTHTLSLVCICLFFKSSDFQRHCLAIKSKARVGFKDCLLVAGAASVTACWPLLCSRGLSRRASWGCLLQPSRLSLEASRLCLLIYRVLQLQSALKASPRRKGRATCWRSRRFYNEILQNFGNDKIYRVLHLYSALKT